MKLVIAGGTGQVGSVLTRAFRGRGDEVVVLSRNRSSNPAVVQWDGRSPGPWVRELDGADAVINLAGRSVNCRYSRKNLQEMMDSRVDSTRAVGFALQESKCPPETWLQMSTATIYSHRYDAPNDEYAGQIGGSEPEAPDYWRSSVAIATAWEKAQCDTRTPRTRKVALRSAMVMSPEKEGVFDMLLTLTRLGLGGPIAGGRQFVSWIHDRDFVRAVQFLLERRTSTGP